MVNTNYPNNLKQYRLHRGLNQKDVAKYLGLQSTDRISRWEQGNTLPNIINLFKLSALYHTTPDKLYRVLFMTCHQSYPSLDFFDNQ